SYTYSLNGGAPQASPVFSGLAAGNYTVTVDNGSGCSVTTASISINTAPGAPAVPTFSITQPTCTAAGTITVTNFDATASYSINGGAPQMSGTFTGLASGTYTITVTTAGGCSSSTASITVNAAPAIPGAAVATVTQPTCQMPTGTIIISAPTGSNLTYSINGGAPQAGTTFTGLNTGIYSIVVTNTDGCTSTPVTVTVDPVPAGPSAPVVTVYNPNCGDTTGAITVTAPVGGVQYSIDGVNFQSTANFSNLAPGNYTITVRDNVTSCTTTSATITVDTPIAPPAITAVEGCQDTADGRRYLIMTSAVAGSFDPATATYEWRNANGMLIGDDETLDVSRYVSENSVMMNGTEYTISLKITVPGGCTVTEYYTFDSVFCDIPKGISPNGDTKNDNFDLAGFNARKVSIFNRYGVEVYSKPNYVDEWYGQSDKGDELPTGTYYYVVELSNGTRTGWVYINR
ncbi:hypothetical protein VF13_42705, partial [Nostoc linckia z16]